MRDKTALKVGIVTVFMIISIASLMVWKSGLFLKVSGYELVGEFENVGGLLNGAEVRYRGYRVGKVFQILPQSDIVLVSFYVKDQVKIPKGSVARVVFDGLVGEKYIAIRPGTVTGNQFVKAGEHIDGYASAGLADAVEVMVKNLNQTEAILNTFRTILTSEKVSNSIRNSILAFESTAQNFAAISGQINSQGVLSNLSKMVKRMDDLTLSMQSMAGTVQTNVLNKETMSDVQKTIHNLAEFSEQLKSNSPSEGSGSSPLRLIKNATQLRIHPSASLQYLNPAQQVAYNGQVDLKLGKQMIRAGFGDREGVAQLEAFQYGYQFTREFKGRVGAFYSKPGVGIDYNLSKEVQLSLDAYDTNKTRLDLTGRAALQPYLDVFMNVRSNPIDQTKFDQWGAGFTIKP